MKNIVNNKNVSCEFNKFTVDAHLCKLRDTPAARFLDVLSFEYTSSLFGGENN